MKEIAHCSSILMGSDFAPAHRLQVVSRNYDDTLTLDVGAKQRPPGSSCRPKGVGAGRQPSSGQRGSLKFGPREVDFPNAVHGY